MDLYHATNGPKWRNNSNWLNGDPCKQSWKGVDCWGSSSIEWLYVMARPIRGQRKAGYTSLHSFDT